MTEEQGLPAPPDDRYPILEVGFNPLIIPAETTHEVFYSLLQLDIEEACDAISAGKIRTGDIGQPYVSFFADDGAPGGDPILKMGLRMFSLFFTVKIDPTKFDRTNPKHEELLQRCAKLVQAMAEAPQIEMEEYPVCYPFEFWTSMDEEEQEETWAKWAKLAEIWNAASKTAD